jgi:hypothetical protein
VEVGYLLHIGHAKDEVEVVLTILGFVVTLLGLGLAAMALWPLPRQEVNHRPRDRLRQRRALREAELRLLDEDVDGGAELGALGEDRVDLVVLECRD